VRPGPGTARFTVRCDSAAAYEVAMQLMEADGLPRASVSTYPRGTVHPMHGGPMGFVDLTSYRGKPCCVRVYHGPSSNTWTFWAREEFKPNVEIVDIESWDQYLDRTWKTHLEWKEQLR